MLSWLFAEGLLLSVCVSFGLIAAVAGLFFGHIILFDSILLSVISGIIAYRMLHLHGAFALLIGLAVFFLLMLLQSTRAGFWIIGTIMSLLWAVLFSLFAPDRIWQYTILGLGFVGMLLLHLKARDS